MTGGGAWLSFGGDKVTESDLERRVDEKIAKAASESEYCATRRSSETSSTTLTAPRRGSLSRVQALAAAQADAAADRKVTNAKLDALTATVAAMDRSLITLFGVLAGERITEQGFRAVRRVPEECRALASSRRAFGGTLAMREAGTAWLPQEEKETHRSYMNRLERSILFGGYEEALSGLVSKPFPRQVTISGTLPEQLSGIEFDIDNEGRGLTEFARDVFRDQIHRGLTFIPG